MTESGLLTSKDSSTVSLSVLSISCHSPLNPYVTLIFPERLSSHMIFNPSGDRTVTAFTFSWLLTNSFRMSPGSQAICVLERALFSSLSFV